LATPEVRAANPQSVVKVQGALEPEDGKRAAPVGGERLGGSTLRDERDDADYQQNSEAPHGAQA
jgi:hypothetical protein